MPMIAVVLNLLGAGVELAVGEDVDVDVLVVVDVDEDEDEDEGDDEGELLGLEVGVLDVVDAPSAKNCWSVNGRGVELSAQFDAN
jgi:predicted nucleotidyltransferase